MFQKKSKYFSKTKGVLFDFPQKCAIYNGSVAINTTVADGYGELHVSSNGEASSTTVNSGGRIYVYEDGLANIATLNSSGYLCVSSGGTANSVSIAQPGASMTVFGTANSVTVSGCDIVISSGGTMNFADFDGGSTLSGRFTNNFSGDTLTLTGFETLTTPQTLMTDLDNSDSRNLFANFGSLSAIKFNNSAVSSKEFTDVTGGVIPENADNVLLSKWAFTANATDYQLALIANGSTTSMVLSLA